MDRQQIRRPLRTLQALTHTCPMVGASYRPWGMNLRDVLLPEMPEERFRARDWTQHRHLYTSEEAIEEGAHIAINGGESGAWIKTRRGKRGAEKLAMASDCSTVDQANRPALSSARAALSGLRSGVSHRKRLAR